MDQSMLDARERSEADAASTPANDPFEGSRFRLMKRLAEGGMSEVYLVEHRQLGGVFVAKVPRPKLVSDARVLELLRVEAQALARLNHPNIVAISAFDRTADGRPFLVLERLRGRTLAREMAARGYIPVLEAVDYVCQVLSALRAVHKLGIVHRDIKPDNIFLHDQLDGARVLKILDFGIVRVLPSAARTALMPSAVPTEKGTVVGTPRFMSPEAAIGESVDPRADLYATGLVLYMLLSGRGPFDDARTDETVLQAHAAKEPLPPSRFARGPVPPELDRVVLRALAKSPEDRFQTSQEFAKALGEIRDALVRPLGWSETMAFSRDPSQSAALRFGGDARPSTAPMFRSQSPPDLLEIADGASIDEIDRAALVASSGALVHRRTAHLRVVTRIAVFILTAGLTTLTMLWVARRILE